MKTHRQIAAATAALPFIIATFGLGLVTSGVHAHTADLCGDRVPGGTLQCRYEPENTPFRYLIPGPPRGVGYFPDEGSTLGAFEEVLRSTYPNACEIRLIKMGAWSSEDAWSSTSTKDLEYSIIPRNGNECMTGGVLKTFLLRAHDVLCPPGWFGNWGEPLPHLCARLGPSQRMTLVGPPAAQSIALPDVSFVLNESDYASSRKTGVKLQRHYRSDGYAPMPDAPAGSWKGLGSNWTHNYAGRLSVTAQSAWVQWGADAQQYFAPPTQQTYPRRWTPMRKGQQAQLVELSAGRFAYYTAGNDVVVFEGGYPQTVSPASGGTISFSRTGGVLTAAQDASGRQLQFAYDALGHLQTVTGPAGTTITYTYKAPFADPVAEPSAAEFTTLSSVQFPDLNERRYVVPDWNPEVPQSATLAKSIVGVVDELGTSFQTINYAANGTLGSVGLAGGVGTYSVPGADAITDPLGSTRTYRFGSSPRELTQLLQPAGSGSIAASEQFEYDVATGNRTSHVSMRGTKACYAYDASGRNVERARVEGLSQFTACSTVTPDNAVLPTGSRKASAEWHPDWRLPTRVAEPGRITTHVYNGQPDPFSGGAIASCAPATALLPDGKPIAVLCKEVQQATTDTDGHLGFGAALQAGVSKRETRWTYNAAGQVLTEDGPRTDVSDITAYEYYADTTADHTLGDLKQVTDATGRATRYTRYDKHGQVLESVDANGAITVHTYDQRQRLLSSSVGGRTTSYAYDAAGQLKKVLLPDDSWIGYDYDDAHRQVAVYDHKGNRTDYVLDNAGKRIGENTKDPGGVLKRQLNRSIDALGRVQQTTGRE